MHGRAVRPNPPSNAKGVPASCPPRRRLLADHGCLPGSSGESTADWPPGGATKRRSYDSERSCLRRNTGTAADRPCNPGASMAAMTAPECSTELFSTKRTGRCLAIVSPAHSSTSHSVPSTSALIRLPRPSRKSSTRTTETGSPPSWPCSLVAPKLARPVRHPQRAATRPGPSRRRGPPPPCRSNVHDLAPSCTIGRKDASSAGNHPGETWRPCERAASC